MMAGLVLSITVLATASIVPYATAGNGGINFIHFDRNGGQVESGDCGSGTTIAFFTRGPVIIKLTNGSQNEFQIRGADQVKILYTGELASIFAMQIISRGGTFVSTISTGFGGATNFDISAPLILGTNCEGDAPRGTTSSSVSVGF